MLTDLRCERTRCCSSFLTWFVLPKTNVKPDQLVSLAYVRQTKTSVRHTYKLRMDSVEVELLDLFRGNVLR
jgi:hypothetical protein